MGIELARPREPELPDRSVGSAARTVRVPTCVKLTAILIVVMVGKIGEWVPGLSSIPLAKICFLLAAISAYRLRGSLPAVRVRSLKVARTAIAFMVLAIVSVTFSIYKSNTLFASEAILIDLFAITLVLKVTQTYADVRRLLFGFLWACTSLAVGVLLFFHGGRGYINDNFDPNEIAYVLDTGLPLVLALRSEMCGVRRLLMSVIVAAIILAVILTGSRGGAIGLGVVMVMIMFMPLARGANGELKRFSITRTLLRVAALVVAVSLAWGYLPAETQERMGTLLDLKSDYNADPTLNASRTVIWRRDFQLALERPIGYGLGSAEAVDGLHGGQYKTAHNSIVQSLVELGVLGMILFLYSYFIAWRELGRISATAEQAPPRNRATVAALYARAMRLALAGNLVAGFFLSLAYSPALWLLLSTAAALVRIAGIEPMTSTSDGVSVRPPVRAE